MTLRADRQMEAAAAAKTFAKFRLPLALAVISSVRVRPTAAAPLRAPLLALTRKELVMISGMRVVVGVGVGRTRRTRNDSILLCPVIQSAQPHDWKICASGSLTISVPLPINKFVAKRRASRNMKFLSKPV